MGWKQNNFGNCEYKRRLEQIRDRIVAVRDAYVEEEVKKLEHLKNTIVKAQARKDELKAGAK